MKDYVGPLDGAVFSAGKPFIAVGWPAPETVTEFDSKTAAQQFIELSSRVDKFALLARLYEFKAGRWERVPSLPPQFVNRGVSAQ
jgi:hypothetical protein